MVELLMLLDEFCLSIPFDLHMDLFIRTHFFDLMAHQCVTTEPLPSSDLGVSLVELERPSAYHTSQLFPSHTFRPGDLARIEGNVSSSGASSLKKVSSTKKKGANSGPDASSGTEGVVFKVCSSSHTSTSFSTRLSLHIIDTVGDGQQDCYCG